MPEADYDDVPILNVVGGAVGPIQMPPSLGPSFSVQTRAHTLLGKNSATAACTCKPFAPASVSQNQANLRKRDKVREQDANSMMTLLTINRNYCDSPHRVPAPFRSQLSVVVRHTLARGKKMPPARAATEGMAGARSASANTKEYVRPRVVFPNRDTMP